MAGVQYLDALFSAIRNTAEWIAAADGWIARANRTRSANWQLSFLHAAQEALRTAGKHLREARAQLDELGSPERLPSLLSDMPNRVDQLRDRLKDSEARLAEATNAALSNPAGQA